MEIAAVSSTPAEELAGDDLALDHNGVIAGQITGNELSDVGEGDILINSDLVGTRSRDISSIGIDGHTVFGGDEEILLDLHTVHDHGAALEDDLGNSGVGGSGVQCVSGIAECADSVVDLGTVGKSDLISERLGCCPLAVDVEGFGAGIGHPDVTISSLIDVEFVIIVSGENNVAHIEAVCTGDIDDLIDSSGEVGDVDGDLAVSDDTGSFDELIGIGIDIDITVVGQGSGDVEFAVESNIKFLAGGNAHIAGDVQCRTALGGTLEVVGVSDVDVAGGVDIFGGDDCTVSDLKSSFAGDAAGDIDDRISKITPAADFKLGSIVDDVADVDG